MAYASGQLTGAANPAQDLVTQIETLLTNHVAWTFVEEVISGTSIFRVWKNAGTSNAWGTDFHIALQRTDIATYLRVLAFEVWDATNKLGIRGCPDPMMTATPEATYASYQGATGAVLTDFNHFNRYCIVPLSTVDFNWWVVVTNNQLIVVSNADAAAPTVLAGVFERFTSHTHEFPLVVQRVGYGDLDTAGSVSRRPGSAGVSVADCFAVAVYYSIHVWTTTEGSVPGDLLNLHGGKALGSRVIVRHSASTGGVIRGLYYDLLYFNYSVGVEIGDTMTIDTQTWLCVNTISFNGYNSFWVNTNAA